YGRTTILGDRNSAPVALATADMLATFGIACGVGLIVFLIALRGTGDSAPDWRRVRRPLLVTWLAMVCTAIALSLQSFVLPYVTTRGGPANSTMNLGLQFYIQSFQTLRMGYGSAQAVLLLIVLAVLGLLATVAVILSKLYIQTVAPNKPV